MSTVRIGNCVCRAWLCVLWLTLAPSSYAAARQPRPLVIDPVLEYSTYLGGSGEDGANGIAVDSSGLCDTLSTDFPATSGAGQGTSIGICWMGFISKFNASGNSLVYSTYLGRNNHPNLGVESSGVALDGAGNAYVTGLTNTANFPVTPGAFQTTFGGGGNAFISKLNATGSALVYFQSRTRLSRFRSGGIWSISASPQLG